jgi:RNA polymerase sigma factor (sigma-70 family)
MLPRGMAPEPAPTPPPTPSEIAGLCARASAGEEEALTHLLAIHHHRLLGFTIRKIGVDWQGKIDAEDVLQEAYVSVFNGIKDFKPQGDDSFYHWATKIIDHRFLDQVRALRRKKRDAAREVAMTGHDPSKHQAMLDRLLPDLTTASRVMRRQDAVAAMLLCMAKLPEDYRQAIQRVYLDEEPIKDVAADMGKTEDALRRLAGRAVERLAACMGTASRYLSNAG